jgi:hypothetical protein
MRALSLLFIWPILAVVTSQTTQITVEVISGKVANVTSNVQLTSTRSGFDAPKVKPLNSSTFDWWYFDVVSPDLDYSLVLVFFAAEPTGLWPDVAPAIGSAVWATAGVTLPDGSHLDSAALGEELTVVTVDNGSSGTLNGTGWGWVGLPDMSQYEIIIDAADTGVEGTVSFQSVSTVAFTYELLIEMPSV